MATPVLRRVKSTRLALTCARLPHCVRGCRTLAQEVPRSVPHLVDFRPISKKRGVSIRVKNMARGKGRGDELPPHTSFSQVEFLEVEHVLNKDLARTQAETFFRAFETRFRVPIPQEGREHFLDLLAQGKLKTVLKYALAQPMAALTRYGHQAILEMPDPPRGYEEYAGYQRFLLPDLLKLNGTSRMRVYSRLTEVKKYPTGTRPTDRSIKLCFELTQIKNIAPKLSFNEVVASVLDHYATLTDSANPTPTHRVERIVDHLASVIFPPTIVYNNLMPGNLTDRAALLQRGADVFRLQSGKGFKDEVSNFMSPVREAKSEESYYRPERSDTPGKIVGYRANRRIAASLAFPDLYAMYHPPKTRSKRRVVRGPRQYHSYCDEEDPQDYLISQEYYREYDNTLYSRNMREESEEFFLEPYKNAYSRDGSGTASIVALLEPLKVRTISIDSGYLRYLASRLQKYLWSTLKDIPIFHLIRGEKVEDVIDFLIHNLPCVSGDYKGATDSIFHNSTNLWVEQIFRRLALPPHLDEAFKAIRLEFTSILLDYTSTLDSEGRPFLQVYHHRLAERGLVPHDIPGLCHSKGTFLSNYQIFSRYCRSMYGDKWVPIDLGPLVENPVVRQARGQLMGNVLSFPILCLINLTGYCNAAEIYMNTQESDSPFDRANRDLLWSYFTSRTNKSFVKKYRLSLDRRSIRTLPVRVNGDDILFQASNEFYSIWSNSLKDVGFVKSVGKNYYSSLFFTINSQIFVIPHDTIASSPVTASFPPFHFEKGPYRLNHLWWSGLSPDFLRKRTDFKSLTGLDMGAIADSRAFLSPVQSVFLATVPQDRRSEWNSLFLHFNSEFISSFDVFSDEDRKVPLFTVSRSLPISLGGLGLELNSPEELTYSQKVLAGRLVLEAGKAPFTLGISPLIQDVLRSSRDVLAGSRPIRRFSTLELHMFEKDHPEYRTEGLQTYLVQQSSRLYPFWREPPPDDITFEKRELAALTRRMFSWALRCRRSLKQSFVDNEVAELPTVHEVVILPRRAEP